MHPAIGGTAKGHLVKEIDSLGGELAKIADATGIHSACSTPPKACSLVAKVPERQGALCIFSTSAGDS